MNHKSLNAEETTTSDFQARHDTPSSQNLAKKSLKRHSITFFLQ